MTRDHAILGVGPGNWQVYYPRYTSPGDPAFDRGDPIPTNPWPSSDWMAMLAERGAPATLCLLAGLGALVPPRQAPNERMPRTLEVSGASVSWRW